MGNLERNSRQSRRSNQARKTQENLFHDDLTSELLILIKESSLDLSSMLEMFAIKLFIIFGIYFLIKNFSRVKNFIIKIYQRIKNNFVS